MFHMLTCFKVAQPSHIALFKERLELYLEHLKELKLATGISPVGERQSNTILDTDEERDHTHFMIISFTDRAQADRAVAYIEGGSESGTSIHRDVYKDVIEPILICWNDLE